MAMVWVVSCQLAAAEALNHEDAVLNGRFGARGDALYRFKRRLSGGGGLLEAVANEALD
tara:strand:- start:318 stop:494 length:177 start_codon:yes stop_codon:yes gene_type:complete